MSTVAYATVSDLEARWRLLEDDEKERAAVLLEDASRFISQQCTCKALDEGIAKMVVCSVVKRSMVVSENAIDAPLTQASMTAGPYTQSYTFANPNGDFYLTKAEKQLLGIGSQIIGSIEPVCYREGRDDSN